MESQKSNESISSEAKQKKIVLMGKKGVGKTSIISIIFNDLSPIDTILLKVTNSISENQIMVPGGVTLRLLDCGGQDEYTNDYLTTKSKEVFDNVSILIFIIVAESVKMQKKDTKDSSDLDYFKKCINKLNEHSPDAKVFVLIHKMDMIAEVRKKQVYERRKHEIEDIVNDESDFKVQFFPTSIWDNSLYKAWKNIMSFIIFNLEKLKKGLNLLMKGCGANEVVLFEKSTFLSICSVSANENQDELSEDNKHFDRISSTIKKLKGTLAKSRILNLKLNTKNSTIYIEDFTRNTYLLISLEGQKINYEILAVNIELTRNKFENIINP